MDSKPRRLAWEQDLPGFKPRGLGQQAGLLVEPQPRSASGLSRRALGGPYNARDVIENIFADTASDELITAAIAAVEKDGDEWVANGGRIQ